ncbi:hypothetical protein ACFW4O_36170 [Streptomyces mutabilis]|uniref:hypothetical protein n=1 Tax=Streptomyces mutabilis TaxID=67332 RepID=UPI0036AF8DDB
MPAVLATVSTGDVGLITTLRPYGPSTGSGKDLAIGVLDEFVQAEATEAVLSRFPDPAPAS